MNYAIMVYFEFHKHITSMATYRLSFKFAEFKIERIIHIIFRTRQQHATNTSHSKYMISYMGCTCANVRRLIRWLAASLCLSQ